MKNTLLVLLIAYILCDQEEEWIVNPTYPTPTNQNPVYPEILYADPQNPNPEKKDEENDFVDEETKPHKEEEIKEVTEFNDDLEDEYYDEYDDDFDDDYDVD